jgi:hypothetical protein
MGFKIKWATVCWLRHKTDRRKKTAGHVSRSSGLLHLEASWARVSQSDLKTGGGVTQMVHVTSPQRLHLVVAEDRRVDAMGRIRPFYPNFTVFYVLGTRGILVF